MNLKRILFYIFGVFFLILALIGIVLPLIPTTPFLLLSLFFISKVSPSMQEKILKIPFFGKAVKNWKNNHTISWLAKAKAITLLIISFVCIEFYNESIGQNIKYAIYSVFIFISIFILIQKSKDSSLS